MNNQIRNFKITHLSYGDLVEFLRTVNIGIEAIGSKNLQVTELFPSFIEATERFSLYVNRQRKSSYTEALAETNQLRSKNLALLKKIVRAYTFSPDKEEQEKAEKLMLILSSSVSELATILSKEENSKNINFFGLTSIVKRLDQANLQLNELSELSNEEQIKNSKTNEPDARLLQKEAINAYRQLTQQINAVAIVVGNQETNNFISRLNEVIDQYRSTMCVANE